MVNKGEPRKYQEFLRDFLGLLGDGEGIGGKGWGVDI